MLKKMRRRFVTAAMAAFAIVMTMLIAGINLSTFYRTLSSQNEMLERIYEYRSVIQKNPDIPQPPISQMSWVPNPGGEFTARFFAVECSANGEIEVFEDSYISSVDEETARDYTKDVLERHESRGRYLDYRYIVRESEDSLMLVFLNIADAQTTQRNLLAVSLVVWAASLLIVFVLVLLFSQRAIQPFARNLEQQKRFITDAGHELKTPVTSIATSADILSSEIESNEWLENIQAQSTRLARLVNDLVMLSRMGEEMPFREKTAFSLSEVVWETAESFKAQFNAEHKQYTQSVEENISLVGDRDSVQKMVSILLDNAIKYSDAEGEINLRLYRNQKKVCLEISNSCDTAGIENPEKLFERFYRPDESRASHTGGAGIGLSIAKSVAENHGGTIHASLPDEHHILFQIVLS